MLAACLLASVATRQGLVEPLKRLTGRPLMRPPYSLLRSYFRSINWADVSACRLPTAGLKPKLGDGGGDEASAHPPVEPLAVDRWENAMPLSLTKAEQARFEAW